MGFSLALRLKLSSAKKNTGSLQAKMWFGWLIHQYCPALLYIQPTTVTHVSQEELAQEQPPLEGNKTLFNERKKGIVQN